MFGPGSLLYESYGDRLGYLCAPATGLMQLMYPPLGKGVEQHSAFYDEPFERLVRSVPQIISIIFDGDRHPDQAQRVRDFHQHIKGSMEDGSRYHALDPETFFWAHATFIDVAFRVDDLFHAQRMTPTIRRAYYAECVEWWRLYGLTMRVVPPTYDDFLEYWDHHVEHVLELTPAAARFVEYVKQPWQMEQPWLPGPVWQPLARLAALPLRDLAAGPLPPALRERAGLPWSPARDLAYGAFRTSVGRVWPLVPGAVRLGPKPRAAYRRRGRVGLDVTYARLAAEASAVAG